VGPRVLLLGGVLAIRIALSNKICAIL